MLIALLTACSSTPAAPTPSAPKVGPCLFHAKHVRDAFGLAVDVKLTENTNKESPCASRISWKADGDVLHVVELMYVPFRSAQDPAVLMESRITAHPPRVEIAGGGFWTKSVTRGPKDRGVQILTVWDPDSKRVIAFRGEHALSDPAHRPALETLARQLLPYHGEGPWMGSVWDD